MQRQTFHLRPMLWQQRELHGQKQLALRRSTTYELQSGTSSSAVTKEISLIVLGPKQRPKLLDEMRCVLQELRGRCVPRVFTSIDHIGEYFHHLLSMS